MESGLVVFTLFGVFLRLNLLKIDLDVLGVCASAKAGFTVSTGWTFLRVNLLKNDFFGAGATEGAGATFFLVKKLKNPPPLFDLRVRAILI